MMRLVFSNYLDNIFYNLNLLTAYQHGDLLKIVSPVLKISKINKTCKTRKAIIKSFFFDNYLLIIWFMLRNIPISRLLNKSILLYCYNNGILYICIYLVKKNKSMYVLFNASVYSATPVRDYIYEKYSSNVNISNKIRLNSLIKNSHFFNKKYKKIIFNYTKKLKRRYLRSIIHIKNRKKKKK